ncbi:MAG: hypothetical protein HC848_01895 [Limnobacter sp.]|nr:hypothetical protein [Limnobacter sp.]
MARVKALKTLFAQLSKRNLMLKEEGGNLQLVGSKKAIDPNFIAEISAHKKDILHLFRYEKLLAREEEKAYLTASQTLLLQMNTIDDNLPTAKHLMVWKITGEIDPLIWKDALVHVMSQHDTLRSRFYFEDDLGFQLPRDQPRLKFEIVNNQADGFENTAVQNRLKQLTQAHFELGQGEVAHAFLQPLNNSGPLKDRESEGPPSENSKHQNDGFLFVLALAYIAFDASSQATFTTQLVEAYQALAAGKKTAHTANPPLQYGDYANWRWFQELKQISLPWWLSYFDKTMPRVTWPDQQREIESASGPCHLIEKTLSSNQWDTLNRVVSASKSSANMVLLSIFAWVVRNQTHCQHQVIYTSMFNRDHPDLENLIGLFGLVLPIQIKLDANVQGLAFVEQVRSSLFDVLMHRDTALDDILKALSEKQISLPNQLFFVTHDESSEMPKADFTIESLSNIPETTKYDCSMVVHLGNKSAKLGLYVREECFSRLAAEQFISQYLNIFDLLHHNIQAPWPVADFASSPEALNQSTAHGANPATTLTETRSETQPTQLESIWYAILADDTIERSTNFLQQGVTHSKPCGFWMSWKKS